MDSGKSGTDLLEWYGRLSTRRVDLVGDYAGKELFLLEGDSLLLRCLSDSKLDFDDGFQLLHAVYAVEYFLQGLVQRKCNFHVVFFDAHKELCIPRGVSMLNRPKYVLARAVIQRHLKVNLPETYPSLGIHSFKSIRDEDFLRYLRDTGVYFVMCHDGANPVPLSTDSSFLAATEEQKAQVNIQETSRKTVFRSMICELICQGYNVALINGLEWMDTKVMSMVVEGSRKAKFPPQVKKEKVTSPEDLKGLRGIPSLEQAFSALRLRPRPSSDNDSFSNGSIVDLAHSGAQAGEQKCQCSPSHSLHYEGLTERVILTLVALSKILQNDPTMETLATSLLFHTIVIGGMSLAIRRHKTVRLETSEKHQSQRFLAEFARVATSVIQDDIWAETMVESAVPCDVSDLVDGRLFENMVINAMNDLLPAQIARRFEMASHALCTISGHHLKTLAASKAQQKFTNGTNGLNTRNFTILPFSSPVFDKHLASINLSVAPLKASDRQSGRIYQEVSHWHNAKRRLDPKHAHQLPGFEKEKSRALRRNQFFMAEMQAYAASLTNAAGKALEPDTISVSEMKGGKLEISKENRDSMTKSDKSQRGKAPPNKKSAGKQAMLNNIAAGKAAKDSDTADKSFSSWHTVRKNLESERTLRAKYLKMKAYLDSLPEQKRIVLQAEVQFHLFCILVEMYSSLRKGMDPQKVSSKIELFGITALLWDSARNIAGSEGLTKTIAQQVKGVIKALNLPDPGVPTSSMERKLAFDPGLLVPKGDELAIDLKDVDFQLLHCGPYMDRNLDSASDARVPFQPDAWQRKVLDELEANRSVFVVAPTSAGKTFISFYAMEKILRSNDDSVLVYVAPTKALVNQIAAEIQARFKKNYKYAGKSVWAIHTRDYRINNPSGCQILVTVPHILQIMLLAPSNAKTWSPKVKYIIFDEIHSIGQAEDGVVWEQLLLLAPSPIIALSATVGNPEMFNSWLASTQQSSGHQVTMVTHQHRYSDLRKFSFSPPKKFAFRGLADYPTFGTLGLDGIAGLTFIHPVTSLINKSRGMPDDLSLEARDCFFLFQAMDQHQTKGFPLDPALDPAKNGLPGGVIRKADIIQWEKELKNQLKRWMIDHDSPFDAVLNHLGKTMEGAPTPSQQVSKGDISDVKADEWISIDAENLYETTLPLLCKLHERDALPAIFFNYDRHKCEGMCRAVMQQLTNAETHWKETSPAWKNKLAGFEKYKREQTKMGAKRPAKPASKKKGKGDEDEDPSSKAEKMQDAANDEANPYANFDPEGPIDGFHFAAKHRAEASELSGYFYQMRRRGLPGWLMDALTRGIGVHHAGMNRKYRQVVEMLFRKGYLRVVIATGTLALGINMPCATVVFSGDSIFLTALNYRQAAGRAGRRGFDLLGNVVFQNLSHGKICRLLSSRLPDLNGHFPVTTTLVLRLFTLLHESGDSAYAVRAINSLLSQPRLYLDGPAFKDQVLHHLRFSIEYLRRQNLLSPQGAPINFAGLTSHLYFTENSSFALNALIKEAYFHELCADINERESGVLRELMLVLAHLFGRRPCRQAEEEYIENIVKRSPSIVFLPPLPPQATRVLREHNQDTLQVFTTYVRTFVDQHIKTSDCKLPLTGIEAGGTDCDIHLPGSLPPTKVRSAFVALSGHDDTFESISDLCRTTRGGVFLEEAVIPHLDVYPDESKTPLNAYLYDFYMHGDIEALERANGVKKSDVWFLLNDFSMVLATIIASLANFLKLPESDLSLLDVIGEGDEHNNLEDDKFAVDSTTDSDGTATTASTVDTGKTSLSSARSQGNRPKTKKKVAESWDDDMDDEGSEPEAANGDMGDDPSKEELERGFLNVYKAISKLRVEFDQKFRKIFA